MKTLLVAALVLVPCLALADSTNAPATPSELTGLTLAQQKLGQQFLASEAKKKKAIEDAIATTKRGADLEPASRHAEPDPRAEEVQARPGAALAKQGKF